MATASLGANPRKETGKGVARKLRAQGQVPGVIYGHGREPQALTVNAREFERLAERVRITSTVIELALDGKTARTLVRELQRDPIRRSVIHIDFQELVAGEKVVVSVPLRFIGTADGKTARTLVRELQRDPIRRSVIHIDFQELVAGEKVVVSVPLRFVGTADGVKNSGGILEEVIHQLHVRCDPANIPDHIDVDVTPLTIGHGLHVSDLKLPEGVETTDDPETTVATVSAPVVEEEVAPAAAEGALAAPEAAAEPELIRKPKAEEEGEEQES